MSTDAAIPETSSAVLPDDIATMKALIRELLAALEKTKQRNSQLEHRLDQLLRRVYGQKSEKLDPAQLLLFVEEEPTPPSTENAPQTAVEPETETVTVTRTKGHGRRSFPADLPRLRKLHDLTEAEQLCPCCPP